MRILLLSMGNAWARYKLVSNHCDNFISRNMDSHEIMTFGYNPGVDILIDPKDDFGKVIDLLPVGWTPDFCLLWEVEWNLLPKGIEDAPFPIVSMIYDWDYDFALARTCAEVADYVVVPCEADKQALKNLGIEHIGAFHYVTVMEEFFDSDPKPIKKRKYDILYTTWINDDVQPERSRWIYNLASLSDKYRVSIQPPVRKYTDYINLLRDTKIAFCYHRFGALTGRNFEAGAQGTIFMDPGEEAIKYFVPGKEYIAVNEENFREQVKMYLEDAERLQEMSRKVYEKVTQQFESRKRFIHLLEFIGNNLETIKTTRKLKALPKAVRQLRRGELYYYAYFKTAPGEFFIKKGKEFLEYALGEFESLDYEILTPRVLTTQAVIKYTLYAKKRGMLSRSDLTRIVSLLEQVISMDPFYVIAYYHLGVMLLQGGDQERALYFFLKGLDTIDKGGYIDPWCMYNLSFDPFNMKKFINKGLVLLSKGEKEAKGYITNLYKASLLYYVGLILEEKAEIYEAAQALAEAHHLFPEVPVTAFKAAKIYFLLGDKETVLQLYKNGIKLCPLNVDCRLEYIQILYFYGLDNEAMKELKQILGLIKSVKILSDQAYKVKAMINTFGRYFSGPYRHDHSKEQILTSSLYLLHKCLEKNPGDLRLVRRIVEIWAEVGRTEKILELLDFVSRKIGSDCRAEVLTFFQEMCSWGELLIQKNEAKYKSKLKRLRALFERTSASSQTQIWRNT